jgi:hypothetical protein
MVGHESGVVPVPPDNMQSVRLYVTLDKAAVEALSEQATPFDIVIADIANGSKIEHQATFQGPSQ